MTEPSKALWEAWEEVQQGLGRVVWVRGYVGTGKSTMISNFFQALDQSPHQAAVIFCRCGDASIVSSSDHGELEALIAQIAEGVRAFSTTEMGLN